MSKTKTKDHSRKFHKRIEKLLDKAGFDIIESDYLKPGPDIIAEAEGNRVIVQCKCAEKVSEYFDPSHLIDEYSKKVEKEEAKVAILPISKYTIPAKYQEPDVKERLLNEDRVVIWVDKDIEYYSMVASALRDWAKYPILGDLGYREEFAPPLSVPAMKVTQEPWEFFIFTISPEKLLKIADVFRRVRDPKAYQRTVSGLRLRKEISEFLKNPKAIFPTNLVCVFREKTKFDEKTGKLLIPQKYSSVWIVDGQHRLYGFCYIDDVDKRKKFNLICAGFNIQGVEASLLNREDQADIFVKLNEKAKRISKELLIAIALSFGTADRRMKVVEMLKGIEIFKNNIKSIDTKGTIHITTFVETAPTRRLVEDNGILSKWYGRKREPKAIPEEDEDRFIQYCFRMFREYFSIVAEVFQEWSNPKKYILATDRGIRALLRIFEHVLEYSNGLKDRDKAKQCLEALKGIELSNIRLKRTYLGEGGADELAERCIGKIQEKLSKFGPRSKVIREELIQPNQRLRAEEIIRDTLANFDREVIGELKYIDPTTFKYLNFIPPQYPIKIYIHGTKKPDKCREETEKFAEKRGAPIEIRTIKCVDNKAYIHDRWLADPKIMIDFGNDLKDESLGRTRHRIIVTDRARITERYRTLLEMWRASYDELKEKGVKFGVFYKS